MKNQAKRFMSVFFAISISAVGTLSQAMEIVSPLQPTSNQVADHDGSIGQTPDFRDHDPRQPGSGGDQFCQSMDRDEFGCVDLGCSYDRRSRRCSDRGQPRPQPRPQPCPRPPQRLPHLLAVAASARSQGDDDEQYEYDGDTFCTCVSHLFTSTWSSPCAVLPDAHTSALARLGPCRLIK